VPLKVLPELVVVLVLLFLGPGLFVLLLWKLLVLWRPVSLLLLPLV
jgi:hypothetical protein